MKYYKEEDIERILKELAEEPNYLHPEEDWLDGICMVETRVESLPTIEVSEDCISRYYVRLIESDEDAYYGDWNETYERGFSDAIDKVLNAPSVVPSREEGEWVVKANGNNECSICGKEKQNGWVNFCGFCGAKMKG